MTFKQDKLYRHDLIVRQLAEKVIEHNSKQYFLFVDLHKVYDSVPQGG